jgi:RNA polymerase sigma-70 factor (ECF subfamily)
MAGRPADNPEETFLQKEMTELVQRQVQALPDKYRTVIYLYYSAGLKIREIADCLQIPENTVKSRMRKAKDILKTKLEVVKYEG